MILKDKCKELNITLAEGKERFGLTHWKQTVPESSVSQHDNNGASDISYHSHPPLKEVAEEVMEVAVEVLEEIKPVEVAVVKAVLEVVKDIVSDDVKRKSVRGLGTKSPYWSELRG